MKYALVTGGSRGIGKAIAGRLARMDYHLLINYRTNKDAADATVAEIIESGGRATALQFDVADKTQVRKALQDWQESQPEACIEVLVNNAGVRKDNLMVMMSDDEWQSVLDIHLGGFFYVTNEVLTGMIRNKLNHLHKK